MACFPVSPRYGKMLSLGQQHQLLPYVVAMVAALSVHEIFTEPHKVPTTEREVRYVQIYLENVYVDYV